MFLLVNLVKIQTPFGLRYCPTYEGTTKGGKEDIIYKAESKSSERRDRLIFSKQQLSSVQDSCQNVNSQDTSVG